VDISNFPQIKIIIEAYNKLGEPLDTLRSNNLYVYEDGVSKKILKVEKIPVSEVVPVDFVFVIDKTGSMQKYINAVRSNLSGFTSSLMKLGIDYRLGLVLFSDQIERIYHPTDNVLDFLDWLTNVKARGGGDEKENALEALEKAVEDINFREDAYRVAVLVTDAPYHQQYEDGQGITNQTTESITELLAINEMRLFAIVPPKLKKYQDIAAKTRGTYYDIDYPFSTILDNFSSQLTNLFALTYRSDKSAIPDSIDIALFNDQTNKLVKKTIPIVELGRKLIIENLLYETNSAALPDSVKELDILADFMKTKENIMILVEGHTDNVGSYAINDRLSLKRANSVKQYLVDRGISEHRIKTKGYGERRPIADNRTQFGKRLNRRTEIIIVSK
jgi:outer membrane protein OmpA-like peptidoglycan-associated protein